MRDAASERSEGRGEPPRSPDGSGSIRAMTTHPLEMLSRRGDQPPARSSAPTPASRTARRSSTSSSTSPTRPISPPERRDRAVEVQLVDGPGLGVIEIVVSLADGTVTELGRGRGRAPDAAVRRGDARDLHHQGAPRVHRRAGATRHHRRRQRADRPVAGRRVRLRRRGRPPHRALHLVPPHRPAGQRLRPAHRGADRPLRPRSQRGDRGHRPRRGHDAGAPRALLRRRQRAAAHRPQADPHHPARGPELHRRRQPGPLAEVGVPHHVRPVRGAGAAPAHLRRRRAGASDPAPRVDLGDGRARTAHPTSGRAGRTRSTPASGASGA